MGARYWVRIAYALVRVRGLGRASDRVNGEGSQAVRNCWLKEGIVTQRHSEPWSALRSQLCSNCNVFLQDWELPSDPTWKALDHVRLQHSSTQI